MGLLDGSAARIFGGIMGGQYLDAVIHRGALADDGQGGGSISFDDEPCKASYEAMSEAQRREQGYADTDQRIFVLSYFEGAEIADLSSDDEISIDGQRWSIESIRRDPARAYFDIRGRSSSNDAAS